ncbi:MAG: glycosyltransferase family 39 protein [Rhizomicrobium sp.]
MMPARLPLMALTAALAFGCALGLAHVACVLGLQIPFDPNEGWNAYFTQAAMAAGSPYPPPQSLMIDNYPPLSFYLVGAVAKLTGDAIVAGRLVALAALCVVGLGIGTVARQMGCSRLEAGFAALLFAAGIMATTDYAGMDDPQMLGHAIAIGGLAIALREPRTPRAMVGAALLFTLAFFIKHNLVVLPAALACWLALADRRAARTFAVAGAIFFLMGLGLFRQTYGFGLFSRIVSARSYAFENIRVGLQQWLPWSAIPLAGVVALALSAKHDRYAVFCVIYAALATATGLYFLGGAGVDANALFDADIALALGAGVLVNRLPASAWTGLAAIAYAVPPAVALWMLDPGWRETAFWLHPMAQERAAAAGEIALLRAAKGPALCEMLSLCYWADKPAEVDVFNVQQAYLTGARSDTPLAAALAARRYTVVQLEALSPFPLPADVRDALFAQYRIARRDDERVFFVPL